MDHLIPLLHKFCRNVKINLKLRETIGTAGNPPLDMFLPSVALDPIIK